MHISGEKFGEIMKPVQLIYYKQKENVQKMRDENIFIEYYGKSKIYITDYICC